MCAWKKTINVQMVIFCKHFKLYSPPHMQCANIGPADYNYDETISTLRYANRAKNIKNKARINEDPKDALLRQFQKEIEELKKKLVEGNEPESKKLSWGLDNCLNTECVFSKCFVWFQVKRSLALIAADQKRWMKGMMKVRRQERATGEEEVRICDKGTHKFKCEIKQMTEICWCNLCEPFHAVLMRFGKWIDKHL